MQDEIIDAVLARGIHADACRRHALVAWIVMRGAPGYPDKFIARLATGSPSPYLLLADTMSELRRKLPPSLVQLGRQSDNLPEVVEVWFSA